MGIKSTNRRPPSAQISISISQLLYIASAWPGSRESFSGIVRGSNLEVSARSGRNYHADWPVPPRCYGAPTTKMRAKPEYGATFWYIAVHQGIIWRHQPQALHLQKQPNLLRRAPPPNTAEQSMPITSAQKVLLFQVFSPKIILEGCSGQCKKGNFPCLLKFAEMSNL